MTSESESYQSHESSEELNCMEIFAKALALDDQTECLGKQIEKLHKLHNEICDYKAHHVTTVYELREHITDMTRELGISGKNMVRLCEKRLGEIFNAAEPYAESGKHPSGTEASKKCAEISKKVEGMRSSIVKSNDIRQHVRQQHHYINRIEAKQRDAIARHSKIVSLESLVHGIPNDDPLFHLASLPLTLFALSRKPNISGHYQKTFKNLEKRIVALFTEIHNKPTSESSFSLAESNLSTGTNGEIALNSLHSLSEHPLDAPISTD